MEEEGDQGKKRKNKCWSQNRGMGETLSKRIYGEKKTTARKVGE